MIQQANIRIPAITAALAVLLVGLSLLLGGCWDRRELQERSFVLAVGVDYAEPPADSAEQAERQTETFVQPKGRKVYLLSLQLLNLSASDNNAESGPGGAEKYFVITSSGQSLFEIVRDMGGQSSRTLWFEHIQTIVINEDVLKEDGINPIVDFFSRDSEMRARIRVITTPNQARKVLEFKTPNGEPSGIFLSGLLRNHVKDAHLMGARTDMGFVLQYLANKVDFVLPRVVLSGDVLKVGGGIAMKQDKMVGVTDEYTTKGMKLIRATEKSALITVSCPAHPEQIFTFELFQHHTKLTPRIDGDKITFTLDIYMIGNIGELQRCPDPGHKASDPAFVKQLEVLFADEVKRNVQHTWQTTQKMKVDVLAAGKALKGSRPERWEKVEDRWPEVFATIPLESSVNVTIRGSGERI